MRKSVLLWMGALLWVLCSCRAVSELEEQGRDNDWLMFRGSQTLGGYVDVALPDSPVLLWEYKHGVRCVASPLVQDGVAYLCDKHGLMLGFDRGGKVVYRHDWKSEMEASWVMRDSVMYVGQMDGRVRALVRTTGGELWSYATEGQVSASPNWMAMDGGAWVLAGSYDGNLYVLDAQSGSLRCRVETGYYVNGAAAVCGEYAVFGGCDAWLRVVNCRTGEVTDSMELMAYIPSSPAVMENLVYVADYSGHVWEFQLEKGKIGAKRILLRPADDEGGMLSMPAVTRDAVYVLAESRFLYCLDREDGKPRWRMMLKGEVGECSPLVCGDKVLSCTRSGIVSIHDTETGGLLWEYETGEQIISSPAVTSDGFYVLTARGTLLYFGF